jgi:hypothetical protein
VTPQQHIEHLKSMVALQFGIPSDQIANWDAMSDKDKQKIAKTARICEVAILNYAWAGMDNKVREKLAEAGRRVFSRESGRLLTMGRFVEACH